MVQTDATTDHCIMCIYEQKSVPECQSTFIYAWKNLSSDVYPKAQPASQAILNLVEICLGENFTQETCINLSISLMNVRTKKMNRSRVVPMI